MGKRGPRRHRGIRVSLGKLAAGRASRLCQPLEKRAGASRSLCDKRIRALEHGRQRARMVRRLVRRQLLQLLSQSKSARTKRWHAKGFAGWFLEASHQGESKRGALEHSAAVPIRRLRFSRSEEHTSELQSRLHLVCRLLLENKTTYRFAWATNVDKLVRSSNPVRSGPIQTLVLARTTGPAHALHGQLAPVLYVAESAPLDDH